MSDWTGAAVSGVFGGVTIGGVISVVLGIYRLVNHTACRSTCCGRVATASLDIGASPYVRDTVVDVDINHPRRLSSDASDVTSAGARAGPPQTPEDLTTPRC